VIDKYRGGRTIWRGPRLLKSFEAYVPDGDESRQIQGNMRLIRPNKADGKRKRWLIASKERTVRPCSIMRDSSCRKFMQAADHDHALAA
jgi:hypothetical protein